MKFIVKPQVQMGRSPITLCWKCSEDPRACWGDI
jgi:hypothetical protein